MTYDSEEETARLVGLREMLTLAEKVQLLTGRDFWTTWPFEKIGLRRILVSDGPSGVRGEVWDERSPSLNLPSATALSSSWDRAIAARYGGTDWTVHHLIPISLWTLIKRRLKVGANNMARANVVGYPSCCLPSSKGK